MTKIRGNETYSTDGPECPFCGFTFTVDDSYYYDPAYTKDECPECEAKFTVEVHHSVSWCCTLILDANPASCSSAKATAIVGDDRESMETQPTKVASPEAGSPSLSSQHQSNEAG